MFATLAKKLTPPRQYHHLGLAGLREERDSLKSRATVSKKTVVSDAFDAILLDDTLAPVAGITVGFSIAQLSGLKMMPSNDLLLYCTSGLGVQVSCHLMVLEIHAL